MTDANGKAVAGVVVTFVIPYDPAYRGATITGASPVTGSDGVATLGTWVLGDEAGLYSVSATVSALSGGLTFSATGTTGRALPFSASALATGASHTCGLASDGSAFCWGNGLMGDASATRRLFPVAVLGGHAFTSLVAGRDHTCALTSAGAAYCWGAGWHGQLGNGASTDWSVSPIAVQGGILFTALTAGDYHTCGTAASGATYCWGDGTYGQLGNGEDNIPSMAYRQFAPVLVQGSHSFLQLTAGRRHTCGVAVDGAAYCWGDNALYQIGDGTSTRRLAPWRVSIDVGFFSSLAGSANHTCGLTSNGAAHCWGDNGTGQLGDSTLGASRFPTAVKGNLAFTSLTAGAAHTCGLTTAGAAYCWGGGAGAIGDGAVVARLTPVPVQGTLTFSKLAAGGSRTCGITVATIAYCWGENSAGAVGDMTTMNRLVPTNVITP